MFRPLAPLCASVGLGARPHTCTLGLLLLSCAPSRSVASCSCYNPNQSTSSKQEKQAKGSSRPAATQPPPQADDDGEQAGSTADVDLDRILGDNRLMSQVRNELLVKLEAQHRKAAAGDEQEQGSPTPSRGMHTSARPTAKAPPRGSSSSQSRALPYAEGRRDRANGSSSSSRGESGREGGRGGGRGGGRDGGRGGGRGQARTGDRGYEGRPQASFRCPDVDAPLAVLRQGKEWLFRDGNPMVYGGAIQRVLAPGGRKPAEPAAGDAVVVTDDSGACIAWGVFNPVSMFRVRLMQTRQEYEDDQPCFMNMPALIHKRIRQARQLRKRLGLPRPETSVYRLVNSEGDRLSGLLVDVLASVVVVQSVAAWAERYRSDIEAAIAQETGLTEIIWRPNAEILKEEGIKVEPRQQGAASTTEPESEEGEADGDDGSAAGSDSGQVSLPADACMVHESGLKYWSAPHGQKTGFYADQRDSRVFVAQLCGGGGARVLDLCCYSGGFSLSAARAGAASVTGVDSSSQAIALAEENARLNGLQDVCTFVRDDISSFMKEELAKGSSYDIVVLDPPKLAPSRSSLARATSKYLALNSLAMKLVAPGGVLMTCSCSGAMTQSGNFPQVVADAARSVGRHITLLRHAGASADHPQHPAYPEGSYLTNLSYIVE